jgi:hypothetical protein
MVHSQEERLSGRQSPVPHDKLGSRDICAGDTKRDDLAGEEGQHESFSPDARKPPADAPCERTDGRVVDRRSFRGLVVLERRDGDGGCVCGLQVLFVQGG